MDNKPRALSIRNSTNDSICPIFCWTFHNDWTLWEIYSWYSNPYKFFDTYLWPFIAFYPFKWENSC